MWVVYIRAVGPLIKQKGFTIVELLIVIVVIAVLATISIVAYNGIQHRAQASALVDGFKKIEKSFRLTAIDQSVSIWWRDTDPILYNPATCSESVPCPGNPRIRDVNRIMPDIDKYLQQEPPVAGLTGAFRYDNDGGNLTEPTCSQQPTGGVNIYYSPVTQDVAQALDDEIDDGSLTTGYIGFSNGNRISYKVNCDQRV